MSLFTELRQVADKIDPQFLPTTGEVQKLLGALIHHLEHGDELIKAAENGVEGTTKLLQPEPAEQPAGAAGSDELAQLQARIAELERPAQSPAPEPTAEPRPLSDEELDNQLRDLEAQKAARAATAQQTQLAEHETGTDG